MASNNALFLGVLAMVALSGGAWASLERSLDISENGIRTQILRQQIMGENVANASTMKTDDGTPYRRKVAVVRATPNGAQVTQVARDQRPFKQVYDPSNPLADKNGFIKMPNISISDEMVDLTYSGLLLEANTNAYNVTKGMYQTVLELVK